MRRCSHKLMPNLIISSWVIILAVVQRVELKCAGIQSPFDILPQGDHYVKYGNALKLFCMLNTSDADAAECTSKDLIFYTYSNGSKSLTNISVVNETTISTILEDLSLGSHNYYCSLNTTKGNKTCFTNVQVGYEPSEVQDFSCKSLNWEKLICRWNPPETYIKTKYKLNYTLTGRASRIMNSCPNNLDEKNNTCIFTPDTEPQYRQAHEYFKFKLTGTNPLGNHTTTFKFHHFAYVIPNKPENVMVVNKTLGSAVINWSIPYPMISFPKGLQSKIEYKSKWDPPEKWKVVHLGVPVNKSKSQLYNLTGLEFAHTPYDVRIYLKSSAAKVDESYWSEPGTLTFITPSTIPERAPRTTFGSFDVVSSGNDTDVFVYWNRIPEFMENGEDFGYNVTCKMNNKYNCDPPIEKTLTYAKYAISDYNEYKFTIYSINREGRSKDSSQVFVPKFRSIPQPESFTKVAYENGVHELSWKPVHHKNLSNYTIFWCEDDRDLPVPCKGIINWVDVGSNVTEKNITMKSITKFYKFAISANLKDGASSGMIWSSCVIFHDKVLKIVDDIRISKVDSREAVIDWEIRCAQSSSFGGFNLFYCPVRTQNNDCLDRDAEQSIVVTESERRNITLTNLKPYTTYKLQISIISYDGARQKQFGPRSTPKRFTTLEDAPSEPTNLRQVNVTNSSITLAWNVPIETNGILQIYKLQIAESVVVFEAKNSDDTLVTEHKVEGLKSYTTYELLLMACTSQLKCSKSSTPLIVTTRIGIPDKMMRPEITPVNGTMAEVTWEKPPNPSGNLNYFELSESINGSYDRIMNFTGLRGEIKRPDCNAVRNPVFRIRAINLDGDNVYVGPWSEPTYGPCRSSVGSKHMVLLSWIFGVCMFSVMLAVVFYIVKRSWLQCRKMKDVEVKLPPGLQSQDLEKDSQDYVHLDRWPPRTNDTIQGSPGTKVAPDEESLLGKKSDESLDHMTPFNMGIKNGGDSSGCSVGRESVSSSVASDHHASSDSGAEADQCISHRGTPFNVWDAFKSQPKSLEDFVKTLGDSHKSPNSNDPLTFANINDWDSDATAPNYTRVGFTDGPTPEKSLPEKGYVTIATISTMNPPQKASSENTLNAHPLDGFPQFQGSSSSAAEGKPVLNNLSNPAPSYVALACLQEQRFDDRNLGNRTDPTSYDKSLGRESRHEEEISGADSPNYGSETETEKEVTGSRIACQMPPYVSVMENPAFGLNVDDDDDEDEDEKEEVQRLSPSPKLGASSIKTANGIDSALVGKLSMESESYSNYIPHHVFGKESLHTQ